MANNNISLVAMIVAAIESGREFIGSEVIMTPENDRYQIVGFDAEKEAVQVAKVLEDGTLSEEVRTLKGLGTKMAHFRYNPNPKPLSQSELKDGKLIVNENLTVDLGNLKVQRVIGAVPGLVILGVGEPDDEMLEVYTFNAQFSADPDYKGTFVDAGFHVTSDAKAVVIDGSTYLIENRIFVVDIKDEKGQVTGQKHRCEATLSTLVPINEREEATVKRSSLLTGGGMNYEDFCYSEDLDEEDDYSEDLYEEYLDRFASGSFNVPIESVRLVTQGNRKDIVIVTKMLADEEGFLTDEEQPKLQLYRINDMSASVGTFLVNSVEAKVFLGGPNDKAPTVLVVDDGVILIRDKFGLKVINDTKVVDGMAGYVYFCGKEYDEDTKTSIYYFGNEADDVRGISYKETDRGVVVKLITE